MSSKYQIVIPKEVRQQLHIRTGQKLQVILRDGVICLVPEVDLQDLRGVLKGMTFDDIRDHHDRF